MPNVQKFNNHKSLFADAIVASVAKELIQEIKKYLEDKQELEFNDTVNRSFANEQMRMIMKKQEKYLLIAMDNMTGSDYYEYEIEDCSEVAVYDLIWIMKQIEFEEGV